ncbi:hypothetical protein LTR42_000773 [Elasticomyces elasticus]|nr:hypothetical protein LTR42_000773 [Elasticomyces elasticus]
MPYVELSQQVHTFTFLARTTQRKYIVDLNPSSNTMTEPLRLIQMSPEYIVKDETKFRLKSNGSTPSAAFSLVQDLATFTCKEIQEFIDAFHEHVLDTESDVKIEIEIIHLNFHSALEFLRHLSTAQVACLKAKDMIQIRIMLVDEDMLDDNIRNNQSLKQWSEHCKVKGLNVLYVFHDNAAFNDACFGYLVRISHEEETSKLLTELFSWQADRATDTWDAPDGLEAMSSAMEGGGCVLLGQALLARAPCWWLAV